MIYDKSDILKRPLRLLIYTAAAFLLAEAIIIYFIHILIPHLPLYEEMLLNAFILTSLGVFILYLTLFRPMIMHIKERVQAEEETKLAYMEIDQVFQTAADGMRLIDNNYVILKSNQTFAAMSGINNDEIAGKKCYEVFPGPHCHTPQCSLKQIFGGKGRLELESLRERKDGSKIHCILTATPFHNPSGELIGIVEDFKDITGRKFAENALKEEIIERKGAEKEIKALKQQIEFVLGVTKTGFDIIDAEFNVRYVDPEWQKVYGDPAGKKCYEYFIDRTESCDKCCVSKALNTRTTVVNEKILAREGNRPVQVTSIPFQNDKGEWLVAQIYIDITERKKMEEEHLKIAKLESLGILAGGIAHDFNNILTAIVGSVSYAKLCITPKDEIYEALTMAENASMRAKELTHKLLTFAKGREPIKKITSVSKLLHDSAGLVLSGSAVKAEFFLSDNLSRVEVDEGQMSQVFNNLIINALQAMPEGGIIRIYSDNIDVGSESGIPLQEGRYVKVSIMDQSNGIPQENLPKIFDPYFSTKQKGSGLGLTTAYYIIKKHNGFMQVESEAGTGSTFHIYVPAFKNEIAFEEEKKEMLAKGKGKILIMDDEELVRNFSLKILIRMGYEVTVASDGAEAIELYKKGKEFGQPFDAVILDLTVPGGMGGKEAVKKLLEIDPGIKAIVSSGYYDDPIMANYAEYGFKGVVAKPYSLNDFTKTLSDVIAGDDQ